MNSTTIANDHDDHEMPNTEILFIINVLIITIILVLNSFTIYLLIKNRHLRTVTNTFAISLAAADLSMGLVYSLYNMINYSRHSDTLMRYHYLCAFCLWWIVVCAGCSIFTLMEIAIERYIAVTKPLSYARIMQFRTVYIMIGIVWIYLIIAAASVWLVYDTSDAIYYDSPCSLLNRLPKWYYFLLILPHTVTPHFISKILYTRIIYIAWKQEKVIKNGNTGATKGVMVLKREAKAAKMMWILLIVFLVCWAPYIILHIVIHITGPSVPRGLYIALEIAKILSLCNSFMNPMIYFWKNRDFREALNTCVNCKKRNRIGTSSKSRNDIKACESIA